MNTLLALALFAAAAFFAAIDQAFLAGICVIAALFILVSRILTKSKSTAKSVGKELIGEIGEDVKKIGPAGIDAGVAMEGVQNMADLAGQQANAPDTHQFKFRGIGEASQRFIDYFKKVFK